MSRPLVLGYFAGFCVSFCLMSMYFCVFDFYFCFFFFQAEDGIRDAQESRGLGDVYKRQDKYHIPAAHFPLKRSFQP